MKVLKISALILALVIAFSGCGNAKNENAADTDTSIESTENTTEAVKEKDEIISVTPEKDSNKVTVKKKTKPANEKEEDNTEKQADSENTENTMYYWCMEAEKDNLNITYHKKDCPLIKDEKPTEVGKEVIKMIGLNRCEECNPPEFK